MSDTILEELTLAEKSMLDGAEPNNLRTAEESNMANRVKAFGGTQ